MIPPSALSLIHSALASPEPRVALRAAAIELSGSGLDRSPLLSAFRAVHEDLVERGHDEEAAFIADAMDMIETWYDRGKASF